MKAVYEIDTWRGREDLTRKATEAAKRYSGRKFTVSIGQWPAATFLVFADSKDEAKAMAIIEFKGNPDRYWANNDGKIAVREVTNSKKYN